MAAPKGTKGKTATVKPKSRGPSPYATGQSVWPSAVWKDFAGLSDSKWSGLKGTFFKFVGLDIHSLPGALTVQQTMKNISTLGGVTVNEPCIILAVSDGSQLFFSTTTGKIWRLNAGTYTLVYTTVAAAGTSFCEGAEEFNGNVFWATQSREHYVATANISNFSGVTLNAFTFTATDANWHPHVVQNNKLFIGDNYFVSSIDSTTTFTANALTLEKPHRVKCMIDLDIDLLIGTFISASVNYCKIYRWDTVQTTWQYAEPLEQNGVNCLFRVGAKSIFANCGQFGGLYQYDGRYLNLYRKIPGNVSGWSPSHNGEILPNAWDNFNDRTLLGFTQDNGTPCDGATYQFGQYDPKYPLALSEDFPVSTGNFTQITINSVVVVGTNVYVSWTDGNSSTSGIDQLDYNNKYASAYLETTVVGNTGLFKVTFWKFFANLASLPTNTSLTFSYYANHGSLTATGNTAIQDNLDLMQAYVEEAVDARVIRMKTAFTVSANNAPVVEMVGISQGQAS